MAKVNSSNLDSVERDGDHLIVTFKSGHTYRYEGGGSHYDAILKSSSPGKYLHEHLKGHYKDTKL